VRTEYNPAVWLTFFAAQIGASAGLTGLIFVAVSINLKQIVELPHLVARSAKALFTLIGVLVTSTVCLVPGQPVRALAGELVGLGFTLWIATTLSERAAVRGNSYVSGRQKVAYLIFAQLSLVPYLIAGVSLLVGSGGGLYWLVAAIGLSYLVAMLDAWVLLIEIQR
jgi:hypothetical protein